MKLYEEPRAPNPRRVRMVVAEKAIEIARVRVDLGRREQLEPWFLAKNPAGTVPVLELDDGTCIAESMAICRYLEALYPEPALFGRDPTESALIEMWTRRVEHEGMLAVSWAVRNGHRAFADRSLTGPGTSPQIPELAERGREVVSRLCDWIDRELRERRFVAGARLSVADFTLLAAIDFARVARLRLLEGRPDLARWHGEVSARPGAVL